MACPRKSVGTDGGRLSLPLLARVRWRGVVGCEIGIGGGEGDLRVHALPDSGVPISERDRCFFGFIKAVGGGEGDLSYSKTLSQAALSTTGVE